MKPAQDFFPYQAVDLTECRIHEVDGVLMVYTPKTWKLLGEVEMNDATGKPFKMKTYHVTEWNARKLSDVLKA